MSRIGDMAHKHLIDLGNLKTDKNYNLLHAYVCDGIRLGLGATDKEFFLEVIENWKMYWMNQTQNSEEDRANYFRRAFGVDSNMAHHLAGLLAKACKDLGSKGESLK